MTDYNDGNWHGWNGGERPVHPKSLIDAVWITSAGNVLRGTRVAGTHAWSKQTVAFRVVKQYREPREFWFYDGSLFTCESDAMHERKVDLECDCVRGEIIHVREVVE